MWCEQCKQRPATVHLSKIVNDEKTEHNLCEVCAQQVGLEWGVFFEPNFSLQHLLAGMVENESVNPQTAIGPKCSNCGLTFADFRQVGQLGCTECYQAFGSSLDPLFRKVQGSVTHTGKVPRRSGGKFRMRKEIDGLREQLQKAIHDEEYENAARLRDEIRRLERQSQG